jgi:DNA-binding XRE family transcriptional regulator
MTATVLPVRKTYTAWEERETLKFTRQEIGDWLGISRDTFWVYENLIARKAIKDFKDEVKPKRKMSLDLRLN